MRQGEAPPKQTALAHHQPKRDYAGWVWAIIDVDLAKLAGKTRRVNIKLPKRVLAILDEAAARAGERRSGLLARAALDYIERRSKGETRPQQWVTPFSRLAQNGFLVKLATI